MTTRLQALEAAAQAFVDKVDAGQARSARSYAAFKEALAIPDEVRTDSYEPTRAATARIVAERIRQLTDEGRTPAWDDRHTTGGMARAAACYAVSGGARTMDSEVREAVDDWWPWDRDAFKPSSDRMRDLERAGALILAEMERLARA